MKFFISLFTIFLIVLSGYSQIQQQAYYDALASDDIAIMNEMIKKLNDAEKTDTYQAYKGALVCKKASLLKTPKQKLDVFKKGVELLEEMIEKWPENIEYRFLRLSVQEHAPKFLKYNKEVQMDKSFIRENFSKADKKLKAIILDYSKDSEALNYDELSKI